MCDKFISVRTIHACLDVFTELILNNKNKKRLRKSMNTLIQAG